MSKTKEFICTVQERLASGESSDKIAQDLEVDVHFVQQIEHDYLQEVLDDYPDTWEEDEISE